MTFSRKALWSFLVGTLAAIPVFHGIPEITHETATAPTEVKSEAVSPDPEARKVLAEPRVRDERDDSPAAVAVAAFALPAGHRLCQADREAAGCPPDDADLAPLSRRALGRPRARAPDAA